jgi:hypothetical protein
MANARKLGIAMWGPTRSGKTIYLASLPLASEADWKVRPIGDETRFFFNSTKQQFDAGGFPPGTSDKKDYSFSIDGHVRHEFLGPIAELLGMPAQPIRLDLLATDVGGGDYQAANQATASPAPAGAGLAAPVRSDWVGLIKRLVGCDGLFFLFNPIVSNRDDIGLCSDYMYEVLHRLYEKSLRGEEGARPLRKNGALPYRLAVCLTQYDDNETFGFLSSKHRITPGADMHRTPAVLNPREAINDVIQEYDARIGQWINDYFSVDDVAYFAVSALGFYVNNGVIDMDDPSRVHFSANGTKLLRGAWYPTGVVAPLVWLNQ